MIGVALLQALPPLKRGDGVVHRRTQAVLGAVQQVHIINRNAKIEQEQRHVGSENLSERRAAVVAIGHVRALNTSINSEVPLAGVKLACVGLVVGVR